MDNLSADSLISAFKVIIAEYGIPKRVMSDAGGNFMAEKFKIFCNSLNIEQAISSSYHHQSNGQVEACMKFIKYTIKKCHESGNHVHVALLQIRPMPLGQSLPSPVTMLFNHPARGIMPVINRLPLSTDNDDEHYGVLTSRQDKNDQDNDTLKNLISSNKVYCSSPMRRSRAMDPWNNRWKR